MSVYSGPEIQDNIGFYVDFSNPKSINGTTLTDLSSNKIPITLTNSGANSLTINNGSALFSPVDSANTATYYTISNQYFNDIKNEITLETCMYVVSVFEGGQNRGVSPRTSETSSPLGFNLSPGNISSEVNTNTGWLTGGGNSSKISYGAWVYVTQTTSVSQNLFKTFINGELLSQTSLAGSIPNGGNGILIGRGFYGGVKNFSGRVGFVRVYNRALSATEILNNFNAIRGRFNI
jgi:hypothetical protein